MADEIIGIKVTTDAAQATAEVQKLDKAFEATDDSVKSLRTQLKEATANVAIMADKFGATSKEAINAAKRAAELKDRIGDAKALTDAFNPDAKFKAVAGALSGVAGGFSALQGAMALFGKENKNVEAALLKVNAAMALSQGLNALGDSIDSFTNLGTQIRASTTYMNLNNAATKTAAVVQKAFGISVVETSVGFKVLKGAIAATGIGLLVTGLASVIANFDAISDWIKKSPLGTFAKSVGALVEQFTDFIGVTSQAKRNIDALTGSSKLRNEQIERDIKLLSAQGGQESEIYKKRTELINNDLAVLKTKVDASGKLYGEDAKKWKDLNNEKLVLTADYNKKSAEETKKTNEKSQKDRDEANKKVEEDTKTANKMLIDLQNEKNKALLADENDKALKQLEIDKKAKDAEIEQLKVSQKVKDELIKLNNEAYEAEKIELEKKAKEDRDKKQEEEQDNLDAFNEKIKDIRIAAIKDDNERAEAERLAELEKNIKELEEDKEFIKLSQEEQAKIKKDLIDASEAEAQKSKNEIVKKGLEEELDILQAQQKALIVGSEAWVKNSIEIEEAAYKLKINNAKGNAKEIERINKEHNANMKNIELQAYVAKKEIEIAKLQVVQQFGSLLQQVNKKNKSTVIAGLIIEKAAAVAMIWANNAIANAKAVATFWITGGLPWTAINTISAALSTAAVVLQTKNAIQEINSQGDSVPVPDTGGGGTPPNTGGGSGSGGSMPTTGGGTPPNTGGGGGGGNTGGGGNGGGGGTVRAYVVQSDIEDAQQRESEIQNRARFE
jgi:hypothetical protein